MKKIIEIDKSIFMSIYSFGEKNLIIGKAGAIGTKLSYYIFFLIYIIGIIYVFFYRNEMIVKFIAVPFSALIINIFLRKLIGRERPMYALGIKSRIGDKKSNSCPSNHSASAMVITMGFIWILPYVGLCLVPIALLTGFSRILSGVHYPIDVICGLIVGTLTGIIGFYIF